jgi:hypothetical protein
MKSPVSYKLGNQTGNYVILTEDYNPHWRLGNQKPMDGYPVNVFRNNGMDKVRFSRFGIVLMGYVLSLLSLGGIITSLVRKRESHRT